MFYYKKSYPTLAKFFEHQKIPNVPVYFQRLLGTSVIILRTRIHSNSFKLSIETLTVLILKQLTFQHSHLECFLSGYNQIENLNDSLQMFFSSSADDLPIGFDKPFLPANFVITVIICQTSSANYSIEIKF